MQPVAAVRSVMQATAPATAPRSSLMTTISRGAFYPSPCTPDDLMRARIEGSESGCRLTPVAAIRDMVRATREYERTIAV
ncbi:MAG: hypothetical protein AB1762_08240 [Gemmatimonadota bacterium]